MAQSSEEPLEFREYVLGKESELRFEVETNETVVLHITNGKAEIYGAELLQTIEYKFEAGSKIAVFTWHGCKLKIAGKTEGEYVSKDTPMVMYVNTHAVLEQMRNAAEENGSRGPKVMICGPTDSGKTTLCRILLNYALRVGQRPTFVDLDVGQGTVSIPGTLGAVVPEKPLDPVGAFINENPVVYHFGHVSPEANAKYYDHNISLLATVFHLRCSKSRRADIGGLFINTCGFVKGVGYNSLLHAAKEFQVDVVVVLEQERLYNELKKALPKIKVVLLPKSGGVVERSSAYRKESRDKRVHEYFFGYQNALNPHRLEVSFEEIEIFKVGAPVLSNSCLPFDAEPEEYEKKLVPVKVGPELVNKLLAVNHAECEMDIIETNLAGFVVVQEVDLEMETLSLLSPKPYPLPNSYLLMGDLAFMVQQ
ncbi:polyribonucleotide 5'-hydroxyl-kinase Clp1-like isoform X2 [Convolutriloba macropyga]|uniref:polyribonucleotide 5'-hydroxyl-kinase Clp1-like isoform X2 n=1 Tax=Convolutriloba macropyga TaxID=536237 RepID=UPI003F51DC5B